MMFIKAYYHPPNGPAVDVYVNAARVTEIRQETIGAHEYAVLRLGDRIYHAPLDGFAHIEDFIQRLDDGMEEAEG